MSAWHLVHLVGVSRLRLAVTGLRITQAAGVFASIRARLTFLAREYSHSQRGGHSQAEESKVSFSCQCFLVSHRTDVFLTVQNYCEKTLTSIEQKLAERRVYLSGRWCINSPFVRSRTPGKDAEGVWLPPVAAWGMASETWAFQAKFAQNGNMVLNPRTSAVQDFYFVCHSGGMTHRTKLVNN